MTSETHHIAAIVPVTI